MANKFRKSVVFQNKAAANRMAANYRKQFGLGLDGEPLRRGRKTAKPAPAICSRCGNRHASKDCTLIS